MRLKENRNENGIVMESLYQMLEVSRQGMFKRITYYKQEQQIMELITPQINHYRHGKDRRAGSRSLFYNLNVKNYGIGVTKFEQWMAAYKLTILPLRIRIITTQSSLQSWNYSNLINGIEINNINQVVAGDLTYVSLGSDLFYVFGLTDLYSARIVGLNVSNRMRSLDAKAALKKWIELRGEINLENCIHHTDGGSQYFSKEYLTDLERCHIKISVAQNCLENGYAEQLNGLIKHHLIPCKQIRGLEQFQAAIDEITYFYNHERKQENLGWRTPVEFESYIQAIQREDRPDVKLFDFEKREKGFLRYTSTKS